MAAEAEQEEPLRSKRTVYRVAAASIVLLSLLCVVVVWVVLASRPPSTLDDALSRYGRPLAVAADAYMMPYRSGSSGRLAELHIVDFLPGLPDEPGQRHLILFSNLRGPHADVQILWDERNSFRPGTSHFRPLYPWADIRVIEIDPDGRIRKQRKLRGVAFLQLYLPEDHEDFEYEPR